MEISERSIRCTFDEARILKASLTLLRLTTKRDHEETERIENFIEEMYVATHLIAGTNIKYEKDIEPSNDDIENLLRKLGSTFLSIPRNEYTDEILPDAVAHFAWQFQDKMDNLNEAQENVLEMLSNMSVEFMLNIDTETTD